jgi:hypothetical protein
MSLLHSNSSTCKSDSNVNESPIVVQAQDLQTLSYIVWFRRHVLPKRGMTIFVACYLHWLMFILFSAMFLDLPHVFEPMALNAVFTDEEISDDSMSMIVDADIRPADVLFEQIPVEKLPDLSSIPVPKELLAAEQSSSDFIPDSLKTLANSWEPVTVPKEVKSKINFAPKPVNVPPHAITAGNFSVWTEPNNPQPGEPYKIMVQIQLPEGTERYPVTDLDGVVVGSDGYQKKIPGPFRGYLPVTDNCVRLEVPIVSADENVQDTVFVRSKLLREAQRLRITF